MVAVSPRLSVCNGARMSLWWLTYNRHGRLHGAVIVEAASLISACISVADNALDRGASFAEGHELDAFQSARIPPGYVGNRPISHVADTVGRPTFRGLFG